MFDLEQAIAEWRRRMAAGGLESSELLDELESHLRDDIERQVRLGADGRQAYAAAVERLGRPRALQLEFGKAGIRNRGPQRKFFRTAYMVLGLFVLLVNTWTLAEYELGMLERFLGLCIVSMIGLYLVFLPNLLDSLSHRNQIRLARVIKFAGIVLWFFPVWPLLWSVHVIHFDLGIVPSTILWCVYTAWAMTMVAYSLNNPESKSGGAGGGGVPFPLQPQPRPIQPVPACPPEISRALSRSKPIDPIVQQSLELARREASRLGHDFIGTEHVLLGVLKLAQGPFAKMLGALRVDSEAVRIEIERLVHPATGFASSAAAVPLTPRAAKAIRLAARQAKALNHPCVGAEHVFLGLLLEGSGIAAKVLKNLGIGFDESREAVLVFSVS
jgi:hypothetical protein